MENLGRSSSYGKSGSGTNVGEHTKHKADSRFWVKSLELFVSLKRILLLQDAFN